MHRPFLNRRIKQKSRETSTVRGEYRVRQVAVKGANSTQSVDATDRSCKSNATGSGEDFARNKRDTKSNDKRPPVRFVCFNLNSRPNNCKHYILPIVKGSCGSRLKKNFRLSFRLVDF